MRLKAICGISFAICCLLTTLPSVAQATCALPNNITNGQVTDAAAVMANFNALLNCILNPTPVSNLQLTGSGGGVVTLQNPSATANYNFNLPATAGSTGSVLTSGGGGFNPETWTPTGISGHSLPFLDGGNAWSGTQTFGPVVGTVSTQSGATYTLTAANCGTTILFTNSAPISLTTLNSLPPGCAIGIEQGGAGQVSVLAGSGATQSSAHGFTKTYGAFAILGLFVDTNVGGSAAHFVITGDGA